LLLSAIYRFEINVKYATILGMVGAGGIGAPLIFAITAYRWADTGALLIGLIIFVLARRIWFYKDSQEISNRRMIWDNM
jgi:ABC-type phosphate/phosphonate transport system permease subunit